MIKDKVWLQGQAVPESSLIQVLCPDELGMLWSRAMSLSCQQHSPRAQHRGPSPGSRGPSSNDLQQQQPGEDQEVYTLLKVELKTAFDWSVSRVKFLLAYNLSDSRSMILQYPTTCRVMYGATVILHSSSGEHFQASRLWSVLGLCRCFKMSLNVMVFQNIAFCLVLEWVGLLLGASLGKDLCRIKDCYSSRGSIDPRTATN